MEKFIIIKEFCKKNRRFKLQGRTVEFKFKKIPENMEPATWIKEAIGDIIRKTTKDLLPSDQVAISFGCKDFARGDGGISFRPAEKITMDVVWDVIASIYQSNSSGLDTETFCLGVTSVRLPVGRGRGNKYNSFQEECQHRRGIAVVKIDDNLCLPRALVVAKAFVDKDPDYTKVRRDIRKIQTLRAKQLVEQARVEIPGEGCGIHELEIFQQYLEDYRIVVYKYGPKTKGRDLIFSGPPSNRAANNKNLNLIHHAGHYNVITSVTAAFCCSYFCQDCHVPYDHKNEHRCVRSCPSCRRPTICNKTEKITCNDCLRWFRNDNCFNHHKSEGSYEKGKSLCNEIKLCDGCLKVVKSKRDHTCGEIFCTICKKHQPHGHLCHIQKDSGKPKTEEILYIFYDVETMQEKQLEDGSFEHQPNLLVFKQRCSECLNKNIDICSSCGVRLQILKGQRCVSGFMFHLLQIRKIFKAVIVLAHNGQAFDHQFVLNHILTETDLSPELIMRGSKIIMLQIENVKFLDSLNYFPMKLAALPKAFGLEDNFKKGYFPHYFNTSANQDYVGEIPAIEYYGLDSLKEEDREKLLIWHEAQRNKIFNFQLEFIDYCISDVNILTEACLKFREQMMTTTNVCPFTGAVTIASACNKVFRRNFLKPGTIGIIPKGGYRFRDKQSDIALKWLIWEENQRAISMQHAAKGLEAVLLGRKVDGFCEDTNQVFEFHGCYYHGCPKCYKANRNAPLHEDPTSTLENRYESTMTKTSRLKGPSGGFEVVEKWECDFRREMKLNPEIELFTKDHPLLSTTTTPLNPRDAFYGGRTGNCTTYYKAKDGEKIKYLDVCSLYPWVCKYGKFPIGHPDVFAGRDCTELNLQESEGLIKAKILPPQNLYHPVLPRKMNNKLLFVLCDKCGETMNKEEECVHTEKDRAITGTWVIDEVLKALEKGYKILEIYEIWRYKVVQFCRETNTAGLFTDMMNTFIKIKQEASGWPRNCSSLEEKDQYIENFLRQEGVKLEFEKITNNPGLRALAKLMLNSFWGKFGQRENMKKTSIINQPAELFELLNNPGKDVNSIVPINENAVVVNWEFIEEASQPLSSVNVCIAAYTTAQARLKLYSYLEMLEERVLYYDTDSVIFRHKEGEFEPPTGDFIGDLTDELAGYGTGSFIKEFVSGGPKNYAYKLYASEEKQEKVVCKVKGISLNYSVSQLVNFDRMKEMVLNNGEESVSITSNNFRRNKDHCVITRQETKMYRPNSTKRIFSEDHFSVPFGYKKSKK